MNPASPLPRQYSHPTNPYATPSHSSSRDGRSSGGFRLPRIFKRLFKFPQMDFEVAVWEMTSLMFAPKKVFRNMYYHKQTKNTYSTADPAFPYLLSFFLLLTSLAWSLAYAQGHIINIIRIAFIFIFVHCLLLTLVVATMMYFAVPKLFGPGGIVARGLGGRRRGLFTDGSASGGRVDGGEGLEFSYVFDVAIRSWFSFYLVTYFLNFLLLPISSGQSWPSALLSNTLYLVAATHATYITFLGYNALPFLSSTHLIFGAPVLCYLAIWLIITVSGWNASLHLAPILWAGGGLRKVVGGVVGG